MNSPQLLQRTMSEGPVLRSTDRRSVFSENKLESKLCDSVCPRTPRRACKDVALARIMACQQSPVMQNENSDFRKSLKILKRRTLTCSTDSHPKPRRPTSIDLNALVTPVRKLSELRLSSPHTTPQRVPGLNLNVKKIQPASSAMLSNISSSDNSDLSSNEESTSSFETSSSDSCSSSDLSFVSQTKRRPRGRSGPGRPRVIKNSESKTPVRGRIYSKLGFSLPKRAISCASFVESVSTNSNKHDSDYGWLPGREQEFENIYTFLLNKLSQNIGGCMYISGLPGTGKTASVNAVLSTMSKLSKNDTKFNGNSNNHIPFFKMIYVNGMRVNEPRQVYNQIYEQLTGLTASTNVAAQFLEKEFCSNPFGKTNHHERCEPVVLVIDELDLLCTRRQDILYSLFDWPNRNRGRRNLVVLAIANTMDLPERLLHPRVASRLGLTRLTFAPYSHEQIAQIVRYHLTTTLSNLLQDKALELACRKVAAVSGDVRRALDICHRAAEIALSKNNSQPKKIDEQIGIKQINAAIKEMFTTPKSVAIKASSLYEKFFLRAVVAEFQARSSDEARLDRCIQQMNALCKLEDLPCPTTSEVFAICSSLGAHKLLITENCRRDTSLLVRLNCTKSDILYALNQTSNV